MLPPPRLGLGARNVGRRRTVGYMPDGTDEPKPGGDTTFGPYPGDALAPPPTPQAPEIPMSESWPWVAGLAVAVRILLPIIGVIVVLMIVIGLLAHWF